MSMSSYDWRRGVAASLGRGDDLVVGYDSGKAGLGVCPDASYGSACTWARMSARQSLGLILVSVEEDIFVAVDLITRLGSEASPDR
jgi:hypothetical protein